MAETKPIRVYEDDAERLESRGSMGDTYPDVVADLLEERDELEERVRDLEAQLRKQGLEKENASA
ncbi:MULTISPECIES: hypothetical protein [Actinomycetes]|uniref:Uncharacterized protein n=2 Tax=Streptomyces TaxID=1883 RepID=A0ABP6HF70_9ACTN